MNPELALALRRVGNDLPAVAALYRDALATQDRAGASRVTDLRYGPHERHRLDVYRPAGGSSHPVVVFFHGGGFIRGNKEHRENLGWYLASQGVVALLANYRLAPESRWPSGPQDVAAVVRWVAAHVQAHGGDPERLVLAGESAGAAHVAAATLRREFHSPQWKIAGAALLSGPYNPRLEGLARRQFAVATPDPRNEPYFGPDQTTWEAASTASHVTAAPFPLMISYTELDLLQMQVQAGELFSRLVTDHGYSPDLVVIPRHNHFSQGYSFGTDDTSVSRPIMDFIARVTS